MTRTGTIFACLAALVAGAAGVIIGMLVHPAQQQRPPTFANFGVCVGGSGRITSPLADPSSHSKTPCKWGVFIPVTPQHGKLTVINLGHRTPAAARSRHRHPGAHPSPTASG